MEAVLRSTEERLGAAGYGVQATIMRTAIRDLISNDNAGIGITAATTIAFGVYPPMVTHFSDFDASSLASAFGG